MPLTRVLTSSKARLHPGSMSSLLERWLLLDKRRWPARMQRLQIHHHVRPPQSISSFLLPDSILALGHHHALLAPCASSATEVPDLDNGWSAPLVHIGASPLVRIPSSDETWTVSLSTLPRQTHLPPAPAQGAHAVKLLSGHSNIHAQLFAEHGIFAPF